MTLERFEEILDDDRDMTCKPNDLAVFNLLAKYLESASDDIVSAACHDQIFLNFDIETLAEKISEEDAMAIREAGVFIDQDSLAKFV